MSEIFTSIFSQLGSFQQEVLYNSNHCISQLFIYNHYLTLTAKLQI